MSIAATGRGVRIAVIDSGIHPQHSHIEASRLLPGISVRGDGTIDAVDDATLDRLGHGTAVTAAIQEKAPEASCIPIRVFHEGLKTTGHALITAIDWAIEQGVDIVNLSLGSTNPAHAPSFAAAIERAEEKGVIVVAPRAVGGPPCYPGALEGVLAVDLDWDCPRETYRPATDGSGCFFASGYPRPIPGVALRRNIHGISFATAQMSGFVACALERLDAPIAGDSRIEAVRAALCA
ncbi:S8 family serine peptidase [Novosphingobium mangrovi (ex Huang et al. 2023)]|uniref:S8 family serine peptidase n=1 Tax=Novosphingobium mangrovi (ex Huang et al. 2023) TaxID=2976432 RepID=A0ABT2IAC7_9SPHN|nr:S8 family serine peptidase [Novosphingobium mangrovi (ex Huang et al. 2023)]MCT2401457.1 S8 family serine peptidase [Novosphingobium mangrovi (ex Huang et al. 2023)]